MKNQLIIDTPPGVSSTDAEAEDCGRCRLRLPALVCVSACQNRKPKDSSRLHPSYILLRTPQAERLQPCQTMQHGNQRPRIQAGWRPCIPIASAREFHTSVKNAVQAYLIRFAPAARRN